MSKNKGSNQENLDKTRAVFLQKARQEFATKGYGDASTNKIVEESGMARGSLYYHFGDKKGLFIAVYKELLAEMEQEIDCAMSLHSESWIQFKAGIEACLNCFRDGQTRTIIIDAYAALEYEERISIQEETLLGKLNSTLGALFKDGHFKNYDPHRLGVLIFGMVSEAGRSLEMAEDIDEACAAYKHNILTLLETAKT